MSHEELEELLPLAALEVLDREEASALEAHLAECPTCPAELAELRDVVGWMGVGVGPVAPPPALRARILEAAVSRPSKRPPARTRGLFSRTILAAGGLAAAAAVVALTMYSWGLATRVRAIESQLAAERDMATFLASPDTATIMLAGTEQAPKARLKLAYDRHTGRALLFGFDLPPAPQGQGYQLWFIAGGKPLPGRVFEPDATGRGWWSDEVPPEGRGASVFAVTVEPSSGVSAPTGPMVLRSVSLS